MFTLKFTKLCKKQVKKNIAGNMRLEKSLKKTLLLLRENPFHNSLHSHKVTSIKNKDIFSSSITGDWRIGWMYGEDNNPVIVCLEIGTHSGSNRMY